ncbi:MAG: ATP-binding protein [Nitrospinota bacterium]|nr:ATP-binding protein [Nitrospinota bacterium]
MSKTQESPALLWAQVVVSVIFLALAVSLGGLLAYYWSYNLHPRLEKEAQAQAQTLTQAQAHHIANALTQDVESVNQERVEDLMDQVLLLTNPEYGTPFFNYVEIIIDYSALPVASGSLDMARSSEKMCAVCIDTEAPLFDFYTNELVGVARFKVNGEFFQRMEDDVKSAVMAGSAAGFIILAAVWLLILRLVSHLRRQVEERREAEVAKAEALREMEAIIAAMPDIFYLFDMEGRLVKWNRKMEELTGLGTEELKGKKIHDFVPNGEVGNILAAFDEVFAKGVNWVEGHMVSADGALVPHHFSGAAIKDEYGNFTGMAGMGRDITEMKKVEAQLRGAKVKAEEATKLKDQFINLVSHDLRSPLGAIMGLLSVLHMADNEERKKDLVNSAIQVGDGLLRMIDQLLDINRLQTGKVVLRKAKILLHPLVSSCVASVNPLAEAKGVELQVEIDKGATIIADPDLLVEVIRNLVSNSIKFCSRGDVVTVFMPDENINSIAVKDTGAGIEADMLPDLFRHEVKTTSQGTSGEMGTGLGLPLSHDIVTAHGGSITAESSPGKGTVFCIELPQTRRQVLIVDDQEDQRIMTMALLDDLDANLEYIEASHGAEALRKLNDMTPTLIITDIVMPEMDGLEFIAEARKKQAFSLVPIIAATAGSTDLTKEVELRNRVFELGASDFIVKPMTPQDLLPRVKRFL